MEIRKSSSLCLFYPLFGVAVAAENDSSVLYEQALDQIVKCFAEIFRLLQFICGFFECLCHDGI